jgi:hypothetical protein
VSELVSTPLSLSEGHVEGAVCSVHGRE